MSIKSCIRCNNYLRCKDSRKSITFTCDRFSVSEQSLRQERDILQDVIDLPFRTSTTSGSSLLVPDTQLTGLAGFDAFETLKAVMADKRIVSPDIKIPEGDFAEAPNFHTWCVSDKFLDQKPFVMQSLIGTRLFGEYCPTCSDTDWMDNGVKVNDSLGKLERKVALLEHGKCPHCHKTKLYFYRKRLLAPYWELALSAGQRGGKSALFGMLASYLTHRQIKMERPNEVYGLLKANILHGTFVALTAGQAKDTLYEPFYGHLLDSPWFRQYHEMLSDIESHSGGEGSIYKLKDTFVFYRHRRVYVYPAGPDRRILRGRTRFVAGIDELGHFPNDAASANVKMNASEVYIALERSLLTVRAKGAQVIKSGFYNVPFGYFINISSPLSMRDKIMELVRKSQGSNKIMGMCMPTWKMNPHVPRSALAEEFKNDPITAMRDYGAEPPLTNSPFISSIEHVEACFGKKTPMLKVVYRAVISKDKSSSELYGELDTMTTSGKPSVLALDAGYSGNAFAFAIGHLANNGYPVISAVGEIMPQTGIRINHSLLYKHLLSKIPEFRNIVLCCADRWNSLKVLADMEQEFDIAKRQYSLKYADMRLFKSYVEDKQITLPKTTRPIEEILKYDHSKYPECFKQLPADHLALQALTVQDTGSAVLKGDQLNDDILRASMLCFRMLIDEDNAELLNGPEEEVSNVFDITSFAVMRNYSGGSGGVSMSSGQGSSLGIAKTRQ